MKTRKHPENAWLKRKFPNAAAREAADDAVDLISDEETMLRHMQVWVDAYNAVAGKSR